MKKILKSFITIILVFTFVVVLTGCGKEELPNDIIESTGGNNDQEESNDTGESNNGEEIKLYSDETKLVFDYSGVYRAVYYFDGDIITGLEYYFIYENNTEASNSLVGIKANYYDSDVSRVYQKGKYVVVEFNEETYKNQTVQKVKEAYSFLEQIYEETNN